MVLCPVEPNVFEVTYLTGEKKPDNDLKDRNCQVIEVMVIVKIIPETKTVLCCGRPGLLPDVPIGQIMNNYCFQSVAICSHGFAVLYHLFLSDRQRLEEMGCAVVSLIVQYQSFLCLAIGDMI